MTTQKANNNLVLVLAISVPLCLFLYYAPCYCKTNLAQFVPRLGLSSSLFTMSNNGSSSDESVVHDEYYELRKVLKAASTEDKTVILATLNEAWAEPNSVFDLFLESFRIGNDTARLLHHLLVIAVDEKAYSRCREKVPHCYFLKSNHSSEIAHESTFMSPSYVELMWTRLAFLQTLLSFGYNFLQTDTDVMWLRDPFPHFNDMDFQTSCDRFNGRPFDLRNSPNNGFIYVRSNNRTIEFYKFWAGSREKYSRMHEQDAFNMIKHDPYVKQIGMQIRFMETDYFGGFCAPSRDFNKVCTMHANCCIGLQRKIVDLRTTLEDWKIYLSLSENRTDISKLRWRVPHQCLIY